MTRQRTGLRCWSSSLSDSFSKKRTPTDPVGVLFFSLCRSRADESACKPDPVLRHRSAEWRPSIWAHRRRVPRAVHPQARASSPRTPAQPHRERCDLQPCSGRGLPSHPGHPRCWCALTAPFHPYLPRKAGGLFSVALSRELPRVAVNNRPALWSPDFPRPQACARYALVPEAAAARPTRPPPYATGRLSVAGTMVTL